MVYLFSTNGVFAFLYCLSIKSVASIMNKYLPDITIDSTWNNSVLLLETDVYLTFIYNDFLRPFDITIPNLLIL